MILFLFCASVSDQVTNVTFLAYAFTMMFTVVFVFRNLFFFFNFIKV